MANKKKADLQSSIGGEWKIASDFYQSGIFPDPDPVPEEPKQQPKAEAPKAADPKKSMLQDYARQTYWVKKEYIEKVKDIAYTERKTVRQTINRLLSLALDQIDKEYQAKGKQLEHYEGEEEL